MTKAKKWWSKDLGIAKTIAVVAAVCLLLVGIGQFFQERARDHVSQKVWVSKGRQYAKEILKMFKLYAMEHDGAYPEFDPDAAPDVRFTNSTDAFDLLMRETDMDSEEIFFVRPRNSRKRPPNGDGILTREENCFSYLPGLSGTFSGRRPLIMCDSPGDNDQVIVGFVGGDVELMERTEALMSLNWLKP